MTRRGLGTLVVLAALLGGTTVAQAQGNDQGPKERGLVFELKLGGQVTMMNPYDGVLDAGVQTSQSFTSNFMVGYKFKRFVAGLGMDFNRFSIHQNLNGTEDDTNLTGLTFIPTFQFHLLEKKPLALYLAAGFHVGFALWKDTNDNTDDNTDITLIGFHLGVGMRYFLHPRFAIGIEGGFKGLWILSRYDEANVFADLDDGLVSFYGAASLLAIW
jgi:hypothetical protein